MPVHELLNEPINVHVEFTGKRVHPTHVHWNKHEYVMKKVNLVHRTNEGEKRIYYFSVSSDSCFMKLRLDTSSLEWRIVEFYSE